MKFISAIAIIVLSALSPVAALASNHDGPDMDTADYERAEREFCLRIAPSSAVGGVLQSQDAGSRINVRSGVGTNYSVQHQARDGDEVVDVLEGAIAADRQCWYKVRLRSGVVGWVRGDFVMVYLN